MFLTAGRDDAPRTFAAGGLESAACCADAAKEFVADVRC